MSAMQMILSAASFRWRVCARVAAVAAALLIEVLWLDGGYSFTQAVS
jgi:hypothetical protein